MDEYLIYKHALKPINLVSIHIRSITTSIQNGISLMANMNLKDNNIAQHSQESQNKLHRIFKQNFITAHSNIKNLNVQLITRSPPNDMQSLDRGESLFINNHNINTVATYSTNHSQPFVNCMINFAHEQLNELKRMTSLVHR
jgi:hypothetical protein